MKRERTTPAPPVNGFPALYSDREWGGRVTRAEVNLDAIASNIARLTQHVAPAALMAVVKANAYGHGAVPVAMTALSHGATWLAVYTVAEAVHLRQSGITAPILVFGPFGRREVRDIWDHALTPTLVSLQAASWLQEQAAGRTLGFHLKLDTGLSRAGMDPGEAVPFLRALSPMYPALRHEGTFTHFASADESDRSTSLAQIKRYRAAMALMAREGIDTGLAHASNSAALLALPDARFDMVRAGIASYGYYPSENSPRTVYLVPALQLVSEVTRVHRIAPGEGVGYGHEFRAARPSSIALVPIGYGDGLPRSLGEGSGRAIVRGRPAPIVGRMSMDQITVDVTDVHGVEPGDTVVLIGVQSDVRQGADELAAQAGTISYDILTGLLPRLPRVYVKRGAVIAASTLNGRLENPRGEALGPDAWK